MLLTRMVPIDQCHFAWWRNTATGEERARKINQHKYDRFNNSDLTAIERPNFADTDDWIFLGVSGGMYLFENPSIAGGHLFESDFAPGMFWIRKLSGDPGTPVEVLHLALNNDRVMRVHKWVDGSYDDALEYEYFAIDGLRIRGLTLTRHGMRMVRNGELIEVNDTLLSDENRIFKKRVYQWTGDNHPGEDD